MSTPQPVHGSAPRRYTSATLTGGVVAAALLFGVALLTEVAGVEPGEGDMIDLAAVLEGLFSLSPWAWATTGTYAVVLTPVAGLVVTAWEYSRVGDRRTVMMAVTVMAILAVSAVIAILR